MSVLTPKRAILSVVAVLFGTSVWAANPSPRTLARMAFDEQNKVGVLFGGRGALDTATSVTHASDETWLWTGARWVQQFPVTKPPARSAHVMTYDSTRGRVIMFGGRQEPLERTTVAILLNDTWQWQNGDWTRIATTGDTPSARQTAAMVYDASRDRVVLFGGNEFAADGKTFQATFDTWEFDGTSWTRVASETPKVYKPVMAYDSRNHAIFLLGITENGTGTQMYKYDGAAHTWTAITPEHMPSCVNEGHLVYEEHNRRLIFYGGICLTGTSQVEKVYQWTGTDWSEITTNTLLRMTGQATTYDPLFNRTINFGGTAAFGTALQSSTNTFADATWASPFGVSSPDPRSMSAFVTDPIRNTIWLFGGLNETSEFFLNDFWSYRNGQWNVNGVTGAPATDCESPVSAFDSDRAKLVIVCAGSDTFEFDGSTWKEFTELKKNPPNRRYAGMVYDAKLKKTLLFGGYANNNYRNDVWSWNGTEWTEVSVSGTRIPNRGLFAMWYDPLQQKTLVYGGLGRPSVNEKITRYGDMWSFDGSKWAKIETTTPGIRFGPATEVDPQTGRLLLFGGLRSENIDEDSLRQFFVNDTWQWDGAAGKWTQLQPATSPDTRENAMMAWDPIAQHMVLFGGYADGFYRSDVWFWDGLNWIPRPETTARRRASAP